MQWHDVHARDGISGCIAGLGVCMGKIFFALPEKR